MAQTTGLLFGSFNPVHTGHLIIANYFVENTAVDDVWFVLSPQNPFKTEEKMLDDRARLSLLELATKDNPAFSVCDLELDMPKPSYTLHTLKALREKYPEREFILMIGSDNLEAFDKWKDYEKLLDLIKIYVYPRSAEVKSPFLSHPNVSLIRAPLLEISSSSIRQALRGGKNPRYLLPDSVLEHIREHGYFAGDR